MYNLTDFEILDDRYVVFCGTQGTVGYFEINDFFFGSHTLYYFYLTPLMEKYKILNFKRLDVFSCLGGAMNGVHFVLIGTGREYGISITSQCVVDIYNSSLIPTGWNLNVSYSYTSERFDDVSVGENYVATAGVLESDGRHVFRFFDRPVTATTNIFSTATYHTYYKSSFRPIYNVALINCGSNDFVSSSVVDSNSHKDVLLTKHNGTVWTGNFLISNSNSTYTRTKAMSFSNNTNTLYLLNDYLNNGGSILINTDVSSMAAGVRCSPIVRNFYVAANKFVSGEAVVTASDSNNPYCIKFYHRDITSLLTPCSTNYGFSFSNTPYCPTTHTEFFSSTDFSFDFQSQIFLPIIVPIYQICH